MTILGSQQRLELERPVETERQRVARLQAESSMLAVAAADLRDGRSIGDAEIDAWLDGWERGDDVPLPGEPIASTKL